MIVGVPKEIKKDEHRVAMALGAVAVEPAGIQAFVTTFLARWGEAVGRDKRRRQPRTRVGSS